MVEIELTADEIHNVASQWKKNHGAELPGRYDGECLIVDESVSAEIEAYDNSLFVPDDEQLKLSGFDYNGVMCSATREDQNGLVAILVASGAGLITETNFKFENGAELVLNASNIGDFSQKWTVFRQSFFTVPQV